jgi:glycosyltransferase involved in cell wall biosynthesis
MRICLYFNDLASWQGGRDLFATLYDGLRRGKNPDDTILLAVREVRYSLLRRAARLAMLRPSQATVARRTVGPMAVHYIPNDWDRVGGWARRLAIDAIGPLQRAPDKPLGVRWVGYIPDCQHRHLPHFFSQSERESRDVQFRRILDNASVVIVNSLDAKRDLGTFYSPFRTKIVSLPFAAAPLQEWFGYEPTRVARDYGIDGRYFICCNQFWQHKNHRVIIDALAIAKINSVTVQVICTGPTEDYRNKTHFGDLMAYAERQGVTNNFRVLGLLPKQAQISLMLGAEGVIQPTLFEGGPGGGAAYEAVSLGQRLFLSDIPVNREISTEPLIEYFYPTNAQALCELMLRSLSLPKPVIEAELLMRQGRERRQAFGRQLREAFATAQDWYQCGTPSHRNAP